VITLCGGHCAVSAILEPFTHVLNYVYLLTYSSPLDTRDSSQNLLKSHKVHVTLQCRTIEATANSEISYIFKNFCQESLKIVKLVEFATYMYIVNLYQIIAYVCDANISTVRLKIPDSCYILNVSLSVIFVRRMII